MRRNLAKWDPEYDDRLDELIHEALDSSSYASLPTEEHKKASWLKVKQELEADRRRNKIKNKIQWFGVVAASVTLGAVLFSPPLMTQAVSPFYQQVKQIGTGLVQVVFGKEAYVDTSQAKTPPPPAEYPENPSEPSNKVTSSGEIQPELVTLADARSNLSFTLPALPVIPPRFSPDEIALYRIDKTLPAAWVEFNYRTKEEKLFCISMRKIEGNQSITSTSTEVTKEVKLNNGISAFLSGGELPQIKFMFDNIYITMYGAITEDELLEAANQVH